MLYTSFYWDCPSCKKTNYESCANEDDPYKCSGCKRKVYLTFTVEVEEIEQLDEENDRLVEVKLTEVGVSRDSGQTWERIMVDTRDLNPRTSPVKPGDLLEYNGAIWEVRLNEYINRLETKRRTAEAVGPQSTESAQV